MTQFTLNVSNSSTPAGIYRVESISKINRGELVYLRMPIKEVVALPGDHVMFDAKGVSVNGVLLPNSMAEPGMIRMAHGDFVVPPYMFVGLGLNNPDSWDSRYLGLLPQSLIEGKVTPVWTR